IGGLTAEIVVKSLDMNIAAANQTRLDWAHAFDLDGDGQYDDVLDPGALLPTPANLAIDFGSDLEFRLTGSFSGTGSYTYDPDFDASTNNNVTINNVILTIGDVRIAGTAEFALEKRTVSVDENGTAAGGVVSDASLLTVALTVSGLGVHVEDLAHVTVSGELALVMLKNASGGNSWTALKMGNVVV